MFCHGGGFIYDWKLVVLVVFEFLLHFITVIGGSGSSEPEEPEEPEFQC